MSEEINKGMRILSDQKRVVQKQSYSFTFSDCNYVLFTFWAIMLVIDRLGSWGKFAFLTRSALGIIVPLLLAAAVAAAVWMNWQRIYQFLTAKVFAVTVLLWILGITVLGTLVVQSGSTEELGKVYGAKMAELIFTAGINDIFHSIWFGGFLVLLSLSLVLVVVKRRSWRFIEWGNLLSHLGVVVVIIGGFIGYASGFRGFMDLHIGEKVSDAAVMKSGLPTEDRKDLGFAIMLEDFAVDRYKPDYKIYVFQGEDSMNVKKAVPLKDAASWTPAGNSGAKFRVVNTYPDFYLESRAKPDTQGRGQPAIDLEITENKTVKNLALFAGNDQAGEAANSLAEPIQFVWEKPSEKELAALARIAPPTHIITFEKKDCCPKQKVEVEEGGEYSFGNSAYKLKVTAFLPDFIFDVATHKPGTRSSQPNNPALQVAITDTSTGATEQRFVFANMPEFGSNHGVQADGPEVTYQYVAARQPKPKLLMIIGKTRELIWLENGKQVKTLPLPEDGHPVADTQITSFHIYASALEFQKAGTRSDQWNNPVVEVEVSQDWKIESHYLSAGQKEPLFMADGKTALALQENAENVKAYRSKLAVIDGGNKIKETTVSVNNPLKYKGYGFYQSNYRKDDPTYSGILVVKDPGLFPVWSGLGMICFGLVFIYYIRPRVAGRS